MLPELIAQIPSLIQKMVTGASSDKDIPAQYKLILPLIAPLANRMIQKEIAKYGDEKIEAFDRDFLLLIDSISAKDHETVAGLLEQYKIASGGIIEQIINRLMSPIYVNGDERSYEYIVGVGDLTTERNYIRSLNSTDTDGL